MLSKQFEHVTLGQRVLFGAGRSADALAAEVDRLGAERVMVVASKRDASVAAAITKRIDVSVHHHDVAPHVPAALAERTTAIASKHRVDLMVSVGGGSTTGLAKAVARSTGLPIIAIPTTYSGSEATNVWGITESARKITGVDDAVLPISVIYDADLTVALPVDLSIASGLNAVAHCIDSMWAPNTDPINQTLAAEGIRVLAAGLPAIRRQPQNLTAREQALYGAYLSAVAFASAGSGLHHKICHTLGGSYDLPHAQTHAIVLPHVLAFNAAAAPDAEARIAAAFGAATATAGLRLLQTRLDGPRALRHYGFVADMIPEAAQLILPAVPASNPRPVELADLERLLHAALVGAAPTPRQEHQP